MQNEPKRLGQFQRGFEPRDRFGHIQKSAFDDPRGVPARDDGFRKKWEMALNRPGRVTCREWLDPETILSRAYRQHGGAAAP